jgi:asparagine synthase (glutamine-hydrolysing)
MCGINGFIGKTEEAVASMNSAIRHRGPDDTGVFSNGQFTIGNNRLAIIDLSPLGHQPMVSADGRYSIAYNGEIYNYKDLRASLEGMGATFKSHSDTEVILEGFAKWGPEITQRLRGMWGLAILDSKTDTLFLSRDPFGIKPLYLYNDSATIAFSSEIRGLLDNEKIDRAIDKEAVREIILLGYAIAPRTILQNVQALLPGEEITINLRTKQVSSKIQTLDTEQSLPPDDDELEKLLRDSVEHHLIADVPVGLFFSGGTDSSALGIMLKQLGVHLTAYHVAIENRNDTPYAEAIAQELGLSMVSVPFDAKVAQDRLEDAITNLDQPIADTSFLPTLLVSERAKADVKVVLSGEGGDELFGGYIRHQALAKIPLLSGKEFVVIPASSMLQNIPTLLRAHPQLQGFIRLWSSVQKDAIGRYLGETMFGSPLDDSSLIRNSFKQRLESREHPDGVLALDRLIYLPDNLLLKIDTATNRQYFATVHGAMMSGQRAAEEIMSSAASARSAL